VTEGHLLTLRAHATGPNLFFQWFHNNAPIVGANSSSYSKVAALDDVGQYWVTVSNPWGMTESAHAPVTVRPVTLPYGREWRYTTNSQNANVLQAPWYAPGFDDSAWDAGPGPFGLESTAATLARLPAPLATSLPLPSASFLTTYFRTTIDVPPVPAGSTLVLTHVVDDGAVFYVDGVRALDYNAPGTGQIFSEDPTPETTPGDGDARMVSVPIKLSPGIHTLAAEVHQSSATSADIVFGAEMRILNGTPPSLTIIRTAGQALSLTWASNPLYSLYEAASIEGPFNPVAGDPRGLYVVPPRAVVNTRFFQIRFNGQ
jgi:hypothetical protein